MPTLESLIYEGIVDRNFSYPAVSQIKYRTSSPSYYQILET